jgi:large subunit ribosomal protein L3
MAGHMGTTRTTTHNLRVMRVDTTLNLIYVKGCVPGFDDADVLVCDAKRKVGWKVKEGVRKGKGMGEWLGGGVMGLPTPGGVKENEGEMGVRGGVVDYKEKPAVVAE